MNTNPENIVIGARAFSDKPEIAAPMVTNYLQGLKDAGVTGCIKHFPGHGDTKADTHFGYASSQKTWSEMLSCEMVTFKAAGNSIIESIHVVREESLADGSQTSNLFFAVSYNLSLSHSCCRPIL